jgi:hypothetical protein
VYPLTPDPSPSLPPTRPGRGEAAPDQPDKLLPLSGWAGGRIGRGRPGG